MTTLEVNIREGRDDDDWELIGLVAGCWSEYPGCVLDVHGEEPELLAIATHYADIGGRFWVAEDGAGRVVGCAGLAPAPADGVILLKKLYVARRARRRGLATTLVGMVEDEASSRAAHAVELWSDTRFEDAHRLYGNLGYVRGHETRELYDLSNSTEYYFRKAIM